MKRILTLALVASLGLVACSKDKEDDKDNNNEKTVVGVWVTNEVSMNQMINGVSAMDSTVTTAAGIWEFTANGEIITSVNSSEPDPWGMFDADTMYYSKSNNMLYVKEEASEPNDSAVAVEIMTLTDSDLDLKVSDSETQNGMTFTSDIDISFKKQ